jgi:hypothetical protein
MANISIIPSEEIGPHEIDSNDEDLYVPQLTHGIEGTSHKLSLYKMQIESHGNRSEASGVSNTI